MPGVSVETLFWILGLTLTGATVTAVLRRALRLRLARAWESLGPAATLHGFAWNEFGVALYMGFVAAAGLTPFALFIFLGDRFAGSNIVYFGLMAWAAFTIVFYFVHLLAGFAGYVAYVRAKGGAAAVNVYSQLLVVLVFSAPLAYLFAAYLAKPLAAVLSLALQSLYVLVFTP